MGKVDLCFEGQKNMVTKIASRVPTNFGRNFGNMPFVYPGMYCWGIWEAGQPGHWKYRSRAHLVRESSVGADEELCPTSAVNRSVVGCAHIEAAAGYGPVAVYAELLVSWPWDQV